MDHDSIASRGITTDYDFCFSMSSVGGATADDYPKQYITTRDQASKSDAVKPVTTEEARTREQKINYSCI